MHQFRTEKSSLQAKANIGLATEIYTNHDLTTLSTSLTHRREPATEGLRKQRTLFKA